MNLQAIKQDMGNITIQTISDSIPDFGKDVKLNLQSVLTPEGTLGLSDNQRVGIALACAYSIRSEELIIALTNDFSPSDEMIQAAKSAATIMAMNNVYYRSIHLADDKDLSKMPARLRMNVLAKPLIAKVDFELMSLAISAINGCGMCINSHVHEANKAEISNEGVQSAIRIASVINAVHIALAIA